MKRLIIHAPNIHYGGGKTLLIPLLRAAERQYSVTAFLDKRLDLPDDLNANTRIIYVDSTPVGRLSAEFQLFRLATKKDKVLCFGNLPPLFSLKAKVTLYIQNRYLVNKANMDGFPIKTRVRILIENIWLKKFNKHAHEILVQTPTMQRLAELRLGRIVNIMPFFNYDSFENHKKILDKKNNKKEHDFLYVATGEPQKNHYNLLAAWKLLARDNIYPSLCLTLPVSKYPELIKYIEQESSKYKLKICNVMVDQQQKLVQLYESSSALLYPSTMESFGLPLIEAKTMGLPIIAPECDYVRDVVDPVQTFDPASPLSIARSVKRFLNIEENNQTIYTTEEFVSKLIDTNN